MAEAEVDLGLHFGAQWEEMSGLLGMAGAPCEQEQAKGIHGSQQGGKKGSERRQREVARVHYAGHGWGHEEPPTGRLLQEDELANQ